MKNLKFLILSIIAAMVWVMPESVFAFQDSTETGFTLQGVLTAVTPLIVMAITELFKWVLPKLPGIVILVLATISSSLVAWADQLVNSGNSWLEGFLYGLLAVVVDQFVTQIGNYRKGKKKIS